MLTKGVKLAQSITEYVAVFGLVIAAFTGVQLYAKRGVQAGLKIAYDQLGRQHDAQIIKNSTLSSLSEDINTNTKNYIRNWQPGIYNEIIDDNRTRTGTANSSTDTEGKEYELPPEWRR